MSLRAAIGLLCAAILTLTAAAAEQNAWPFWVQQDDLDGTSTTKNVLGPIFERKQGPGAFEQWAFRPIWLRVQEGDERSTYFIYPLFSWKSGTTDSHFSLFHIANQDSERGHAKGDGFDLWPVYFSRDTGDPATSYHAFFPIAGTMRWRFGKDRLTWVLFPLYFNTDKDGMIITSTPWPFLASIHGAGHHGFEFWPVAGTRARDNDYRRQFLLWPLLYRDESHLDAPVPDKRIGFLPFYTRETALGYKSETFAWPFFGYTHVTAQPAKEKRLDIFSTPQKKYDEIRYFWPLLVQGRGEDKYVNRFGPIYTHSIVKGLDKTWVLWPAFRDKQWVEDGVAQEKFTFLYFVFNSEEQRRPGHPEDAPAYKRHLWPFYSAWNNAAGRRQFQFPSPLEPIFPHNDTVRQIYSPLFSIYRYDQRAPGDTRHSLLWNLVSWRSSPREKEFHLGPFGWHRDPAESHGHFFLFAFRPQIDNKAAAASPP
jgi:hypothetical protein